MPTLREIADRTQTLRPSKWQCDIHHYSEIVGITVEETNGFLNCIQNGGTGSKSDGSWRSNSAPFGMGVDLTNKKEDNVLNLHYHGMGRRTAILLTMPSSAAVVQGSRYIRLSRVGAINNEVTINFQRETLGSTEKLRSQNITVLRRIPFHAQH